MQLGQFTEHRFVKRKEMIEMSKLPTEEVTEILTQVSRMIPKKGWEFLLPYDMSFVSRFPEVVERQSLIWQMKKQQRIRRSSSSGSSSPTRRRSRNKSISSGEESGSGTESEGQKSRRRRQSESGSGSGGRRQRRNSTRSEIGIPTKVET